MQVIDSKWAEAEKLVDPNHEGSSAQKLGLSKFLCPTCKAHLYPTGGALICLNACHLTAEARARFAATLDSARRVSESLAEFNKASIGTAAGMTEFEAGEPITPNPKRRRRHKRSTQRGYSPDKRPRKPYDRKQRRT